MALPRLQQCQTVDPARRRQSGPPKQIGPAARSATGPIIVKTGLISR
jgi:hypothetical protein